MSVIYSIFVHRTAKCKSIQIIKQWMDSWTDGWIDDIWTDRYGWMDRHKKVDVWKVGYKNSCLNCIPLNKFVFRIVS